VIRWSPEALERLELIEAHVAADNPTAAAKLVGRLIARAERLAAHPALGREVSEPRSDT
jgi:toxin ParE1/3/4